MSTLDGTNGTTFNGVAPMDLTGESGAQAGDVNRDGLDDFLIGAHGADPNGSSSGATYLVFGSAGGYASVEELAALDGLTGATFNGVGSFELSGLSVDGAGDVDGDGLADFLISADEASPNGTLSGSAYLVYGDAGGYAAVEELGALDGADGATFNGAVAFDRAGTSVRAAGDVNADGFADFLISAEGADTGGAFSGTTYLIFGTASRYASVEELAALDGTTGTAIHGAAALDASGTDASGAGDVNGDGFDDILIGARGADPNDPESGAAYLVYGSASGFGASVELSALDGTTGTVFNGSASGEKAGFSVSSAGDFNGDGHFDLLIGASSAGGVGPLAGAAYLVFGTAGGFASVEELSALDGTSGFLTAGLATKDVVGHDVGAAGDINGDGLSDVLIGTPGADPNGSRSGAAYLIYGTAAPASPSFDLSTIDGSNGVIFHGVAAGYQTGVAVGGVGDVDFDGFEDLLVTANFASPNGIESGLAHLVYGDGTAPSATVKRFTRTGDGPLGGDIVPPSNFGPVARCVVDFADDDAADNGAGGASLTTVTLTRSNFAVNLIPIGQVADVQWEITTDRSATASAEVTFRYLDTEVAGLSEIDLRIYQAPTLSGDYIGLPTVIDTALNTATVTVDSFSFFALAESGLIPVELSVFGAR